MPTARYQQHDTFLHGNNNNGNLYSSNDTYNYDNVLNAASSPVVTTASNAITNDKNSSQGDYHQNMMSDEFMQLANGNDDGSSNRNNVVSDRPSSNNGSSNGAGPHRSNSHPEDVMEQPEEDAAAADGPDDMVDESSSLVVRTMEVPEWLSTQDVTKHLVGLGKKNRLETEFECNITLTGRGSGTKDRSLPGYHLPHLLVTLKGTDIRQIGRVRKKLEDSLMEYIAEHTSTPPAPSSHYPPPPPPSLGRLLYQLALSNANASPKTKDHTPHRTVLARAHYSSHRGHAHHHSSSNKKVWMNVVELPQNDTTKEYHGRFLAGKNGSLLEYYRTKFSCRVDIYGVWDGPSEGGNEGVSLLCEPYVLVTSEESKACVDRCLQFIEHRIREHEEKWGVSRQNSH